MNEYLVILAVLSLGLIAVVLANRRHAGVPHRAPERMPTLPVRKVTGSSAGLRSALMAELQPDQSLPSRTGSAPVSKAISLPGLGNNARDSSGAALPRADAPSVRDLVRRAEPPLRGPQTLKKPASEAGAHGLFRAAPPQLTPQLAPQQVEPQPGAKPADAAPSKREQMRSKLFSSPMPGPEQALAKAAPANALAPASDPAAYAAFSEGGAEVADKPQAALAVARQEEAASLEVQTAPTTSAEAKAAGADREFSAGPDETAVVEDFDPLHDVLTLPAYPMLAEYVKSGYLLTFEDGQNLLLAGLVEGDQPLPVWEVVPPEAAEDRTAR